MSASGSSVEPAIPAVSSDGRLTYRGPFAIDSGKRMWLTLMYCRMDIREANSFLQFL